MAELERSTFIALLNRLGSADDAEALAAARELHATITENGVTWDSLLVPDSAPAEPEDDEEDEDDIDADVEDEEEEEEEEGEAEDEAEDDEEESEDDEEDEEDDAEDDEDEDEDEDEESEEDDGDPARSEQPAAEAGAASSTGAGVADAAEDKRLLERLLARKGLSQETRDELAEFQRDLDKGKLSSMDRRYVRALAKRMGL